MVEATVADTILNEFSLYKVVAITKLNKQCIGLYSSFIADLTCLYILLG